MNHFVAYHNAERMGRSLAEGEPFEILTNQSVTRLMENTVWLVEGQGKSPRRYALASVFVVKDVGQTSNNDFKYYARGQGHVFHPYVPLNDLDWFGEFFKTAGHFGFGVREIKPPYIDALLELAKHAQMPLR